eukprot:gene19180-biopygen20511
MCTSPGAARSPRCSGDLCGAAGTVNSPYDIAMRNAACVGSVLRGARDRGTGPGRRKANAHRAGRGAGLPSAPAAAAAHSATGHRQGKRHGDAPGWKAAHAGRGAALTQSMRLPAAGEGGAEVPPPGGRRGTTHPSLPPALPTVHWSTLWGGCWEKEWA